MPWLVTVISNPLVSHKDTNVITVSDPQYHREADNSKSEEGNMKDLQDTAASEGQSNANNEAVESSKGKGNKKSKKGKKEVKKG